MISVYKTIYYSSLWKPKSFCLFCIAPKHVDIDVFSSVEYIYGWLSVVLYVLSNTWHPLECGGPLWERFLYFHDISIYCSHSFLKQPGMIHRLYHSFLLDSGHLIGIFWNLTISIQSSTILCLPIQIDVDHYLPYCVLTHCSWSTDNVQVLVCAPLWLHTRKGLSINTLHLLN